MELITTEHPLITDAREGLREQLDELNRLRRQRRLLLETLEKIRALASEWNANKMGGVSIQRRRWLRLAEIADDAVIQIRGEMTKE